MSETKAITVRGLRKTYGRRTVVDGIDLDVGIGEIVGVIGANGAGKTTTVECIQGLTHPDAGTVRVRGYDPTTELAQARRLIGSQLQDSSLPDRLRVDEALRLFGTGPARRGEALLEQFGLIGMRRSAFASLSGGERQRLFLVLALLNRPEVVILDELTQGLDPAARRGVWAAVEQLPRDGVSVLLVTHELDEAEALCDRVVAMRSGRVLDSGAPSDLIDRYGRRATISFTLPPQGAAAIDFRSLRGVHDVDITAGRVTVNGDRQSIAHVGAALVAAGTVPADLTVDVPDLEDALVALLEKDESTSPTSTVSCDLIGATQ